MNTEYPSSQLRFLDITDRKYNALVIGIVGRGAAFHIKKTFLDVCVRGKKSTGCRELQLFLPAPKNQTNLFPRVLTFQEKMLRIFEDQKRLRRLIHSEFRARYILLYSLYE